MLRTADHGSSVVGERMAAGCLERPASSTLTLVGTRRTKRMLSGNFDDTEATETCKLQSELSQMLTETDKSDSESDAVTTTTYLSELDTSDSFYESRLMDALEAQENAADVGRSDTDSSDDGTYSADSFSDLAPYDDQPLSTSSASSNKSVDVDSSASSAAPRQSDPDAIDNNGQDEQHAPVAANSTVTSDLLCHIDRQRSVSDVKTLRLTGGNRCSSTVLRQPGRVTDSALPHQSWKRMSL